MRYCTSSMFLLSIYAINLMDSFKFVTAITPSTRSTPAPRNTRNTAFDLLRYWSGESFIKERHHDHTHSNHKTRFRLKRNYRRRGNPRSGMEQKGSTRFGLVDVPITSTTLKPDDNDTFTNLKLHGYSLKENMIDLMAKVENANVSVSVIGTTIEFHEIVLCQITKKVEKYFRAQDDKYVVEQPQKKIILIVHGLNPMGFRSVPCLYKSESFLKLVRIYASYLDKFDIFLIPMGNPDGIADESLSFWSKNKSPQATCPGVAVDRNFDVAWNNTVSNSCSQQYPGPRAFSEPESRAVADLIHHYNHKIAAYIHVHAGTYDARVFKGDAVLYPKGFTDQTDDDKYVDIAAEIEETMRNSGFKVLGVTVTSLYEWYGLITGNSVDYATTVYGIPFGMEFVMQPYTEAFDPDLGESEEYSHIALDEVWKKVIHVIFTNIYRNNAKAAESQQQR